MLDKLSCYYYVKVNAHNYAFVWMNAVAVEDH